MTADDAETGEPSDGIPPQIGAPARRALERAGYLRLSQLAGASEAELRQLHGMGPKALGLLRDALAAQGMSFAEE
ncbi:DNA-binding protein [Streptomyces inhibens]|uniref:DNA-binding protein n=1 Tax=Streptomyces inhibens TaxID=2293571 RepID=UPI001EE76617|nr:DNA-binding protein [Streptomyces inhibens]UKY48668.1 DNA-binding protein [Streptomyces inhibens]